jgi:hypothetical protein
MKIACLKYVYVYWVKKLTIITNIMINTLYVRLFVCLCCLTPFSTIFQLYRDGQFFGGGNRTTQRNYKYTDLQQATDFIT